METTVEIENVVETVTISSDGMSSVEYLQTIKDPQTGNVISESRFAETQRIADVFGGVVKTVELFLVTGMKSDISATVTKELFKSTAPPKIEW